MNETERRLFADTASTDDAVRMEAFTALLSVTEERVSWLPEVFPDLEARLLHPNSYQRSIAVMLLANLAKSDAAGRVWKILPRILALTTDEKFITRRQCVQCLWRFAVASDECRDLIVEHLRERFSSCVSEKHFNLIRRDILVCLARIAAGEAERGIHAPRRESGALYRLMDELIRGETDEKYRRSYLKALRESGCVIR